VGGTALAKDKLAEVLVGGDQEALLGGGELEHCRVGHARRKFGDVDDVVTVCAKTGDDRDSDALVDKQPHADLEIG